MDDIDIEIDIAAARGVGNEREVESVCSTFWNALRECSLLIHGCPLDFAGNEVARE